MRMLFFPVLAVDHTLDSVSQVSDVEINQQPYSDAAESHVRQKLSLMDRMKCVDALYLDNHQVLNDEIDSVAEFDFFSIEDHR